MTPMSMNKVSTNEGTINNHQAVLLCHKPQVQRKTKVSVKQNMLYAVRIIIGFTLKGGGGNHTYTILLYVCTVTHTHTHTPLCGSGTSMSSTGQTTSERTSRLRTRSSTSPQPICHSLCWLCYQMLLDQNCLFTLGKLQKGQGKQELSQVAQPPLVSWLYSRPLVSTVNTQVHWPQSVLCTLWTLPVWHFLLLTMPSGERNHWSPRQFFIM